MSKQNPRRNQNSRARTILLLSIVGIALALVAAILAVLYFAGVLTGDNNGDDDAARPTYTPSEQEIAFPVHWDLPPQSGRLEPEDPATLLDEYELDALAAIFEQRLEGAGISGFELRAQEGSYLVARATGPDSDSDALIVELSEPAEFEFRRVVDQFPCEQEEPHTPETLENNEIITCDLDLHYGYHLGEPEIPDLSFDEITAGSLTSFNPDADAETLGDEWIIRLEFDKTSTQEFAALTRELKSQPAPTNMLALVFDGQVLSAPSIGAELTDGTVEISGSWNEAGAKKVATQMRTGAGYLVIGSPIFPEGN